VDLITAWVSGSISTAELHECMTCPEYLRWVRHDWAYELIDRYQPEPAKPTPRPEAIKYSLGTPQGCALEWAHGGFAK